MLGEIGEAEKKGKARQEISKIDAQTAVLETERKSEKAKADAALTTTQTELDMGIKLAQIQASRNTEAKDAELQRVVETKRAEMELERRRANEVVRSRIDREVKQQTADAAFYSATKDADAALYREQKVGEGHKFRAMTEADAAFYAKQKEAEGLAEMAKAYGELANVLGGPSGLLQFMMLQNKTYEKLAETNARALNGLQPKISVWNTGSDGNADATAPIRNLMQSLPPLLQTVQEQTGITPPTWLAQMPPQQPERPTSPTTGGKNKPITNGARN
jgi:flotillin